MSERETRTRRTQDRQRRPAASRRREAGEPDERRARDETEPKPDSKPRPKPRAKSDSKPRPKPKPKLRAGESERPSGEQREAGSGIGARRAAALAARYVVDMTGRRPEGLTSLSHSDDGWRVDVEALESKRIPDSTDILAVYRVDLDQDGELLSYRRERRYHRGHVDGGEDQ